MSTTTATRNNPKSQRSSRSRKPRDGKNSRQQIEEAVADRIIELLDQGKLPPWEKDWQDSPHGFPVNAISMKPYRGINRWMTLMTQQIMGYADPRWLTYRQAEALGGHVRRGENSTTVVFWKRVTSRRNHEEGQEPDQGNRPNADAGPDGEKAPATYPMLRAYHVFNVEQTEECRLKPLPEQDLSDHDPVELAEAIIAGMPDPPGFETYPASNQAPHYTPRKDLVRVPEMGRYRSVEGYYNTVFHELVHATGHPSRLHRFELDANARDLHAYGREELIAGMGSAMLSAHAGTGAAVLEKDAAYIRSWRDAIQADKPMVIRAATLAQRAADLILGENPPEFTPEKPEAQPEADPKQPVTNPENPEAGQEA